MAQALMLSMRPGPVPTLGVRAPLIWGMSSVLIGSLVPNFPRLPETDLKISPPYTLLVVFVKDFERGFLE